MHRYGTRTPLSRQYGEQRELEQALPSCVSLSFILFISPQLDESACLHSPAPMIRRMADKLGHISPQKLNHGIPQPSPSGSSQPPSLFDPRGSISTERTSQSEWSKQGESMEVVEQLNVVPQILRVPRKPRGTYRLSDFSILRTLGTGSFGRVHLGQSHTLMAIFGISLTTICMAGSS